MPNGQWVKTHFLGVLFETPSTNFLIGTLQDSTAQVGSNSVFYPNAVTGTGLSASLKYSFSRQGVSQDVIIHRLPLPEEVGFSNSEPVKLVLISEFVDSPTPLIQERVRTQNASE